MRFSIRENAWGNWYGYAGGRRAQVFCNTSTETQQEQARKWLAGNGTCPDCGGQMDVDEQCVISETYIPAGSHGFVLRDVELPRRERVAKAALCNGCETCIEL